MSTAQQQMASRQNGAKSNGPQTEEGKAKSARNAIKHGLCSKKLTFEDKAAEAEFEALHQSYRQTFLPQSPAESGCIKDMAFAVWRQRVCLNMELALLQAMDRGEASAAEGGLGLPSLNTLMRYKAAIQNDHARAKEAFLTLRQARLQKAEKGSSDAKTAGGGQAQTAAEDLDTNEPGITEPEPKLNRKQRRRLEAVSRKKPRR